MFVAIVTSGVRAGTWDPEPITGRAWTMESFRTDAGLAGRYLFTLDFDERGTAWFATAVGLVAYDGYDWRRYGTEDGLPSAFVRCATVARDGRIWVGTDQGIVIFDGSRFLPLPGAEGLAGPNVRRIVEDPDGTMWVCSDSWLQSGLSAGLTAVRATGFTVYREADGLPSDYVSDYFRDASGRQFVLTREGLAQWQDGRWMEPLAVLGLEGHADYMWSIVESPSEGVIVASSDWLFVLKGEQWSAVRNDGAGFDFPKLCTTAQGEVLTVQSADAKSVYRWNGEGFDRLTEPVHHMGGIEFVAPAPDGSIWALGIDTLMRWNRGATEWTEYAGLPPLQFADASGAVWFAGNGRVVRHSAESFESIPALPTSLTAGAAGDVWGWDADGVVWWSSGDARRYSPAVTGLVSVDLGVVDTGGVAWFIGRATDNSRAVCRFDGRRWRRSILPALSDGLVRGAQACAGTLAFVARFPRGPQTVVLIRGEQPEVIPVPPAAVPHDARIHMGVDQRLWLYGEFGTFLLDESGWVRQASFPGRHVIGIANDGPDLWFAYTGLAGGRSGMSRLRDGVVTDFDIPVSRVVSLHPQRGAFCVSEQGLVRPPQIADGIPEVLSVPVSGEIGSTLWTGGGEIWAQIGESVARYRPDGHPPRTIIVRFATTTIAGEPLAVTVEARERFRPRGSGRFTCSWRVDAGPWTPFEPIFDAKLPLDVPTGSHRLEVRARDEGMDIDPSPASVDFTVHAVPLGQRSWFWPTVAAIVLLAFLTGAVAIISRVRIGDRARRLESEVRARTLTLRASEDRFRRLVEYATDAFFLFDADGRIAEVNEATCKSLGRTRMELLGMSMADVDDRWTGDALAALADRLADDGPVTIEGEHRRRDGSTFPVESHTGLLDAGDSKLILALARDITDRRQVESRNRRMMDELDHRVKNNLATVIALATQTLARSDSLETFRESFIGRIHAMARVHEDLARRRWRSIDLAETIRRTLEPYADDAQTRITTAGPSILLPADVASPLALAVHELATNAAKHGALSRADGRLEVKWVRDRNRALVFWVERGGPPVTRSDTGFGVGLIQGLLRHDIRGEAEITFEQAGLTCTLSIPCEDAAAPTSDASSMDS